VGWTTRGRPKSKAQEKMAMEKAQFLHDDQKQHLAAIRQLVKDKFHILQDNDIITNSSMEVGEVFGYKEGEEGVGPDANNLVYDMVGPKDSAWNVEVYNILTKAFKTHPKWCDLSDEYVKDMLGNHLRWL
jgi:hypothetical protein